MTFIEKLRALTRDAGRAELDRRCGFPKNGINNRLARALNVSFEWLFDDDQDMPPLKSGSPEPPAATLTPDEHARRIIAHAGWIIHGRPLRTVLRVVLDALAEQMNNAAHS